MPKVSELFGLQELDSAIDACQRTLDTLAERLGETEELLAARDRIAGEATSLEQLRPQQRDLEWQVVDLQERITPHEKRLYGGSIRNPKELASLQEDVQLLQAQKARREDQLLAVMAQVEEAEVALAAAQRHLAAVEAGWRREQADILAEQDQQRQQMAGLEEHRQRQEALLSAQDLALYEALRQRRQGRAVARVEKGLCGGCRIALPTTLLQRARSGSNIVQCTSCERILYMG